MDCVKCGAPLPAKSNTCTYCGALNDTDLRAIHRDAKHAPDSDRFCPRCSVKMSTIDLGIEGKFFIERCAKCFGIFFDPAELEALIDKSVSNVYVIDRQRMAAIIEQESVADFVSVTYVKCPVCRELMNRKSYGSRSGVIVDICKPHGVWMDGGELRQLLKWTKAGGKLYDDKRQAERARAEELERKRRRSESQPVAQIAWSGEPEPDSDLDTFMDVLGFIVGLIR